MADEVQRDSTDGDETPRDKPHLHTIHKRQAGDGVKYLLQ